MGGSLFAPGRISGSTGGDEANGGKREVRSQLAVRDWHRVLPVCGYCRASVGPKSCTNLKDIWCDAVSLALRHHCHGVHARSGICHAVLWYGCGTGIGVYTDGLVLSIFRRLYWVARRGADRKRYGVERVVWRAATHYGAAAEFESNFNVCHEQRRWRDGQND